MSETEARLGKILVDAAKDPSGLAEASSKLFTEAAGVVKTALRGADSSPAIPAVAALAERAGDVAREVAKSGLTLGTGGGKGVMSEFSLSRIPPVNPEHVLIVPMSESKTHTLMGGLGRESGSEIPSVNLDHVVIVPMSETKAHALMDGQSELRRVDAPLLTHGTPDRETLEISNTGDTRGFSLKREVPPDFADRFKTFAIERPGAEEALGAQHGRVVVDVQPSFSDVLGRLRDVRPTKLGETPIHHPEIPGSGRFKVNDLDEA